MHILDIESTIGNSKILVGESLENVVKYLPRNKKIAIISDTNVIKLYGDKFPDFPVIDMGFGEENKTLENVNSIYQKLCDLEFDRSSYILAIGGGIVCDTAGFIASTYMRGIDFGFVSTTLLAQVDASVGGKNGVNFQGYKNMIGCFNLPQFVICEMNMLQTLTPDDILCGMGEIVKHGAIKDAKLFDYIEQNAEKAKILDKDVIARFVYDSVVIKSNVVNADAREKGERKKLNFGHTFGHAIEKVAKIPHGMAISIGMVVAAQLSVDYGYLSQEKADRLKNLLIKLGLPISLDFDKDTAINALKRDKKRSGENIDFILLTDIGEAIIKEIEIKELEKIVKML
jgi:3-dehydroquinate synthase